MLPLVLSPSDNSGDYTGAGAVSAAKGVAIRLYNRAVAPLRSSYMKILHQLRFLMVIHP